MNSSCPERGDSVELASAITVTRPFMTSTEKPSGTALTENGPDASISTGRLPPACSKVSDVGSALDEGLRRQNRTGRRAVQRGQDLQSEFDAEDVFAAQAAANLRGTQRNALEFDGLTRTGQNAHISFDTHRAGGHLPLLTRDFAAHQIDAVLGNHFDHLSGNLIRRGSRFDIQHGTGPNLCGPEFDGLGVFTAPVKALFRNVPHASAVEIDTSSSIR